MIIFKLPDKSYGMLNITQKQLMLLADVLNWHSEQFGVDKGPITSSINKILKNGETQTIL